MNGTELSGRSTDVPRMTGGMREIVDDVYSAKRRRSARFVGRSTDGKVEEE